MPPPNTDRSHEIEMTSDGILAHMKRKKYDVEATSAAQDRTWTVTCSRGGFDVMARAPTLLEACLIVLQHSQRDDG